MISLAQTARTIFQQALANCDVEAAMTRHISVQDGRLRTSDGSVDLSSLRQIRIVAAGKAANGMLRGIWQQFPSLPQCEIAGVLISPERPGWLPTQFQYFAGGHPLPNDASFAGARAALDLAGQLRDTRPAESLCLFLISGGASSMMELPLDPNISLEDTIAFHRALIASGASIAEMNCVRKQFSAIKGGRLALAAGKTAAQFTFMVSDVPEGREDTIGSGPTLPDSSNLDECRQILDRFGLLTQFPASVNRLFQAGIEPENRQISELQTHRQVILSSRDLAEAAARSARMLGFSTVIDNACDEWEYRDAANYLLQRLQALRREGSRICLISVGEIAVALPSLGATGIGGRNQQFALYSAALLAPQSKNVAILSAGTDGIDGNSPAAGGVIDASALGNPDCSRQAILTALANFDAYSFLRRQNAAIETGPTGNNIRDLRLLLVEG